jgi:hypothetical protein
MTAPYSTPGFDFGRVISRMLGLLRRNFVAFLLLAILLVGLPTAGSSFLQLIGDRPMFGGDNSHLFDFPTYAFLPVSWLIGAMANAVMQGAVFYGAVSDLSGRKVTFGEALGTGLRFFLPLVAIGLISVVGCFFGYLIFVVPGVLLALAWSVAAPTAVAERTGVLRAFSRSAELTRNHRAAILGLSVIAIVISWVIQLAAGATVGLLGLGLASMGNQAVGATVGVVVAQSLVNLIAQTINALIGSTGVASIYYELRFIKEGVGIDQLAAVFD